MSFGNNILFRIQLICENLEYVQPIIYFSKRATLFSILKAFTFVLNLSLFDYNFLHTCEIQLQNYPIPESVEVKCQLFVPNKTNIFNRFVK